MSLAPANRKLAAILAADVAGFSRLVAVDEATALTALEQARRTIIDPEIGDRGGRIVKTSGDGILVEFRSAVEAMRCAMSVQSALSVAEHPLQFRIGVNVGDVVIDGDDILGDGVNLAARLEAEAEPGGVAFSGAVREYLLGRITADFHDGGQRNLKNIDRSVHVWHWRPDAHADVGEAHFRRALRLSPLDPLNFNKHAGIGAARAAVGDYTKAAEAFSRALHERPGAHWILRIPCACLQGSGRKAEARAAAAELPRHQPDFRISRYAAAIQFNAEIGERYAALMRELGLPEQVSRSAGRVRRGCRNAV